MCMCDTRTSTGADGQEETVHVGLLLEGLQVVLEGGPVHQRRKADVVLMQSRRHQFQHEDPLRVASKRSCNAFSLFQVCTVSHALYRYDSVKQHASSAEGKHSRWRR